MSHPRRRIIIWLSIFVFATTLILYILTLSPTINSFDSAEFTTASYSLGIIHSPGYPLFLSFAHLTTLIPLGDPAYKINLLNAIFAAAAIGLIFLCCWKLTKSVVSSLFCALFLGFTNMFWSASVVTEVYAFDALLGSGVLYWIICLDARPTKQNMFILLFLYGLTISHHLNAVLFSPWIALLILSHAKKIGLNWKNLIISGAIFILPFTAYIYFPIRTIAHTQLDYVRTYFYTDLTTIKGIFWMISGGMFASDFFGRSFLDGLYQFHLLWKNIWLNLLGIGLLFSVYGLWVLFKERKILTIVMSGCIISIVFFFSFYDVVDNAEMTLPALMFLTIPMAWGVSRILSGATRISSLFGMVIPAALSFFLFVDILSNWMVIDRHQDWSAYNYSHQVMNKLEPNAFVISQWTAATPLEYVQIVEKTRPDVEIFDRGLYVLGLQDKLSDNVLRDQIIIQKLNALIRSQMQIRPVYATENDPLLNDIFCFVSDGIVYRIFFPDNNFVNCVGDDIK